MCRGISCLITIIHMPPSTTSLHNSEVCSDSRQTSLLIGLAAPQAVGARRRTVTTGIRPYGRCHLNVCADTGRASVLARDPFLSQRHCLHVSRSDTDMHLLEKHGLYTHNLGTISRSQQNTLIPVPSGAGLVARPAVTAPGLRIQFRQHRPHAASCASCVLDPPRHELDCHHRTSSHTYAQQRRLLRRVVCTCR